MNRTPSGTPPSPRDPAGEIRALIDQHTSAGPFVPRVVASRLVAELRRDNPALLASYLDASAEQILYQLILDLGRSERARAAQLARRWAFREAAGHHANGDSTDLHQFLDTHYPVEDGTRRRLADMTAVNLKFVADHYDRRAEENAMWGAFLRALAKRMGPDDTVASVYSELEVARMFSAYRVDTR